VIFSLNLQKPPLKPRQNTTQANSSDTAPPDGTVPTHAATRRPASASVRMVDVLRVLEV